MPQGDKSTHTGKQNRPAAHIEASVEDEGVDTKSAEARIWATANKITRDANEPFEEEQ
jgi:hypothetical protein